MAQCTFERTAFFRFRPNHWTLVTVSRDHQLGAPHVALLLTLLIVAACKGNDLREVTEVRHPIISLAQEEMTISGGARPLAGLETLQERLANARRTVTIGTLDGPPETIFGRLGDLAVTSWGELLVLDAQAAELRSFDEQGRYVRTLLTRGQGPSELFNPLTLDFLKPRAGDDPKSEERLMVTTRSHIKIFRLTRDSIALERSFGSPDIPFPADACATENRIVIRDNMAAGKEVIVVMSYDGHRPIRFGKGYEHGSALARDGLSEGPLACSEDGSVVMGFLRLPYLRLFDAASGTLKWSAAFPDFKPLTAWDRVRDGSPRFAMSFGDPGDLAYVLVPVPDGAVLAQVFSLGAGKAQGPRAIQEITRRATYIISLATGQGALVSDSLPRVIAMTKHMLWTEDYAPQGHTIIVGFRY